MSDAYLTLDRPVSASLEVKRSVFRCDLTPVADETAARAAVDAARKEFWDARHHCSAFVLGPGQDVRRSNDDGEPSGTAGMPMLDALLGAGLTDVVAVVTRWFGGTLLGTGALVKAYGDAVREALDQAEPVRFERRQVLRTSVDLADMGRVENAMRTANHAILAVDYAADGGTATLDVGVPARGADGAHSMLAELTGGACTFVPTGHVWSRA